MNDRPDARELLQAVQRFIDDDIVPALEGHLRYQARVAANVVGIVAREIEVGEAGPRAEWRRLASLFSVESDPPADADSLRDEIRAWNLELVERIRSGEADAGPWREALVEHLRRTTADKLAVALGRGA
jgi:hypothetical protein